MATTMEVSTFNKNIQSLNEDLKSKKTLISKCTNLCKTLISNFNSLENSLISKTLTLDSNLQSLNKSLADLGNRENAVSSRLRDDSIVIEAKKQSAIDAYQEKLELATPMVKIVECLCRRMDYKGLSVFLSGKSKFSRVLLMEGVKEGLKECLDGERMVLEVVKEFVEAKETAERVEDRRWGCGVVVSGLFPVEELVERKGRGAVCGRKIAAEAEVVLRKWREVVEKGNGKMGCDEVAMLLQVVVGFGIMEVFEFEFYKRVVMEFATKGDIAKLGVVVFGDRLSDFIDQLMENGKDVEAVYFASEAGLTGRFRPASLLQSCMQKNTEIVKNCTDADTTEEAIENQVNYVRSLIKCVEDNKLEAEISVGSLHSQLSVLGKLKAANKKGKEYPKPPNKRARGNERSERRERPRRRDRPPRSEKRTKYSSYSKREVVSPAVNPGTIYQGTYALPGRSAYDPGLTASTYGQRYGASLVDQITQQHYVVPSGVSPSLGAVPRPSSYVPTPSTGPHLGSSYGLQSTYGVYDYGATTASTYQPPSYVP